MLKFKLSKKKILSIQKNRPPFLMIDNATEVIPGKRSSGYKILKYDEWFFKVHWPGDPNMPGVLQLESMVQMASLIILSYKKNANQIMYLSKVEKLELKKKIIPGDKLFITSKLVSWNRGYGKFQATGKIKNEVVCTSIFSLILPSEFNKYIIKKK